MRTRCLCTLTRVSWVPGTQIVLRDFVRDDVKYVIVDEYQDVNPIQERLVGRLVHFGANLCVVGDDDQTIYQWRGSEVSNIISFAGRCSRLNRQSHWDRVVVVFA